MKKSVLFFIIAIVFVSTAVVAKTEFFQASLTPDHALHSRLTRIEGISINAWGENEQIAFAIGLVNGAKNDSAGIMWSFALNYADNYSGVQWAMLNACGRDFFGWQAGLVNYAGDTMLGLQTGKINIANRLVGVQFGVLNITRNADPGLQIGLINIITETKHWFDNFPREVGPAMVFANWRF